MAHTGTIGKHTFDEDLKSLVSMAEVFGVKVWVDETLGGDWGEHYVVKQNGKEVGTAQTNNELYGILMDMTNGE